MKLFIGNCTPQNHNFIYRVLESKSLRQQAIPPGMQTGISGDLDTPEIDYILKQHEIYGMRRADELDRVRDYVGLCYSIDKPITTKRLQIAITHNTEVLVERGVNIRKESAVAAAGGLENTLAESGRPERLTALTAEMLEEDAPTDTGQKQFGEGVIVSRDEAKAPPTKGSRKKIA